MLRASVLIPTHEHAATLPFAVKSVQSQGIDEIEILIVGDGVDGTLRAVIERLCADDARIRFFDLPKAPRHGEIHRDAVLRQARGRIVCYQCDDDLWLPGHLQDMEAALEAAVFAGSMHADVSPDGRVRGYIFDLDRPEFRKPWLAWTPNRLGEWASDGFGRVRGAPAGCLSAAGRRLGDHARRLPDRPDDVDGFLANLAPDESAMARSPHFPKAGRIGGTDGQRADELSCWRYLPRAPGRHAIRSSRSPSDPAAAGRGERPDDRARHP